MIECQIHGIRRSQIQSSAGAAREFSYQKLTFCADSSPIISKCKEKVITTTTTNLRLNYKDAWLGIWWVFLCFEDLGGRFGNSLCSEKKLSADQITHTNSTLYTRISPQWLSELRWLWPSVPWWNACELVSLIGFHTMPGQQLCWVKGVCMFRYNPSHAPLAEWSGFFTCHCSNMGMEQTPNKSQHRMLTLEKKILSPLLLGFELTTFQSWVWCFTNKLSQAAWDCSEIPNLHLQVDSTMELLLRSPEKSGRHRP